MSEIGDILKEIKYCNIATTREDGSPWNSPVFFVHDGQNFYWWSALQSVHSQNILRDSRVFITVYDSTLPEDKAQAAYFQAQAGLLEDSEIKRAIELYNNRANSFQLDDNVTSGAAPTRLFKAKPEKIWINDSGKKDGYYIDIRKQIK